jgi:transposase
MDNATWHRRKATHWLRWQPKYLPPYSPDLNPIEPIWLTIKARGFNNYVYKTEQKLLERLDQAILDVIDNPKRAQKTARIGTLI